MSEALRIAGGTAVWEYAESDGSYPLRDRTKVFSHRHETNPMRQVTALRTKVTDTGDISAEIVMIRPTPRRTGPSSLLYPFEETVDTEGWLALSEETLDYWDNDLDAVYDDL